MHNQVLYRMNEKRKWKDSNNSAIDVEASEFSPRPYDSIEQAEEFPDLKSSPSLRPLTEQLYKICVLAFHRMKVYTFPESLVLQRCLEVEASDSEIMKLIQLIRIIFWPEDYPRIAYRRSRFIYKVLEPCNDHDILQARSKRKEEIMHRAIYLLERFIKRKSLDPIQYTLSNLQLYVKAERRAEQLDAYQLEENNRLAQPHVIPRTSNSYVCVLCGLNCHSISSLQAHLITLKHHILNLPSAWESAIEQVKMYEQEEAKTSKLATQQQSLAFRVTQFNREIRGENITAPLQSSGASSKLQLRHSNNSSAKDGAEVGASVNQTSKEGTEKGHTDADEADLKPMMVHYMSCLFCGTNVRSSDLPQGHICTNQLQSFIDTEIEHFNEEGSPLVCLLCDYRCFDSPEALMVHVACTHCAGASTGTCTLCDTKLTLSAAEADATAKNVYVQRLLLDRHLREAHLPELEILGRLLHSFGSDMFDVIKGPVKTNKTAPETFSRSYRCCFRSGESAGAGPPFPFEHWRQRRKPVLPSLRDKQSAILGDEPKVNSLVLTRRPPRISARRKCLLNPQRLCEHFKAMWIRGRMQHVSSSIFAQFYKATQPASSSDWCDFQATSNVQLIAHVASHHGGNYMLQPGLRESFKQALILRAEKRTPPLEAWSWNLLQRGMRLRQSSVHDDTRKMKDSFSSVEKRHVLAPVREFNIPPPSLGEKIAERRFKLAIQSNLQLVQRTREWMADVKSTFDHLDPRELCCLVHKECFDSGESDLNYWTGQYDVNTTLSAEKLRGTSGTRKQSYEKPSKDESIRRWSNFTRRSTTSRRTPFQSSMGPLNIRSLGSQLWALASKSPYLATGPATAGVGIAPSSSHLSTTESGNSRNIPVLGGTAPLQLFCRICRFGPLESLDKLNSHVEEVHVRALKDREKRARQQGSFQLAVDPARICFQCYRVVDSFIALQVHIVCAHASLYPFVCGLCHEPLSRQNLGDPEHPSEALAVLRESTEKADSAVTEQLLTRGYLSDVDVRCLLPTLGQVGANMVSSFFHSVHTGLARAIVAQEIQQIRSAVMGGYSAMKVPAVFLLEAIREHERMHIEQICNRQQSSAPNLSIVGEPVILQGGSENLGKTVVSLLQEFNKRQEEMRRVRVELERQLIGELVPHAVEATVAGLKRDHLESESPSLQRRRVERLKSQSQLHLGAGGRRQAQTDVVTPELVKLFEGISVRLAKENNDDS